MGSDELAPPAHARRLGVLKRHLVAQPATLAAHPTPLPAHAAAVAAGAAPFQPRLVYYNDAHHFSAKRIEPPIAVHDLYRPVDEVVGTGVDLLVFGLGYGDVFFHASKVGRVVGQQQAQWDSFIDWRIMKMVEGAAAHGTDQLREVLGRGREMGLTVYPSLKMQDNSPPPGQADGPGRAGRTDRTGKLKWERGTEVCIGAEGMGDSPVLGLPPSRAEFCYDFAHPAVTEYKLALAREVLEDYEAAGLELDFMFDAFYFKVQEPRKAELMTAHVTAMRRLADEIGERQHRRIGLMARVPVRRDDCLAIGLDVEAWLQAGLLDIVVAQEKNMLLDTAGGGAESDWLPAAANAAEACAFYRPPTRLYDERTSMASPEMYRALMSSLRAQGWRGLYDGYLPWPFGEAEHAILRESAFPEAMARKSKRFLLQPRESEPADSEVVTTPDRGLPAVLKEGGTVSLPIYVGDDVDSARRDRKLRPPELTLRFESFCTDDSIEMRLNGVSLDMEEAEVTDERALQMLAARPGEEPKYVTAPQVLSAHWFRFRLDKQLLQHGWNTVEVVAHHLDPRAGFDRSVNGLEVLTRYKTWERPQGLQANEVNVKIR